MKNTPKSVPITAPAIKPLGDLDFDADIFTGALVGEVARDPVPVKRPTAVVFLVSCGRVSEVVDEVLLSILIIDKHTSNQVLR